MALDPISLRLVAPLLKGASILSLGYPDIAATAAQVKSILGVEPTVYTNEGMAHGRSHPLPETRHVMSLAGVDSFWVSDVFDDARADEKADLNFEQPQWAERFDLVINPGTAEHCFNVAGALFNAWGAVKKGGHVLHVAPATMMNHGFWNFCPTVFYDFAADNGGAVVEWITVNRDGIVQKGDPVKRFRFPHECVMYALIRRREALPRAMPTQWRYRR